MAVVNFYHCLLPLSSTIVTDLEGNYWQQGLNQYFEKKMSYSSGYYKDNFLGL